MKTINLQDSNSLASNVSILNSSSSVSQIYPNSLESNSVRSSVKTKPLKSKKIPLTIQEKVQKIQKLDPEKQSSYIRNYFLSLLAKRDYSESELTRKAKLKGIETSIYESVLQNFKDKKWIDDQRFAQNLFQNYKGQKGKSWICQKLTQKGIAKSIVESLFENQLRIEPDPNVKTLLERKHKITDWQNIDIKVKNKVIYFLSSRGFSNAFEILKQWQSEQ